VAKGKKYGGRVKGTPNVATASAREAIANFVDGNAYRLQGWLDQIAKDDPEKAFRCLKDILEFHVPRLERTEIANARGETLQVNMHLSGDRKPT
jgi:hypothetical protein